MRVFVPPSTTIFSHFKKKGCNLWLLWNMHVCRWALHPRRYATIVFHKEKNLRYLPGSEPPANFHLTLEAAVQCEITRMSLLWMPGWIPMLTIFSWFEFQKEECREDFKQVNFNQTSLQTIFWLWLKCSRRLMDRSNFNWTVGSSFYFTMY